jgi:hypothetical protein
MVWRIRAFAKKFYEMYEKAKGVVDKKLGSKTTLTIVLVGTHKCLFGSKIILFAREKQYFRLPKDSYKPSGIQRESRSWGNLNKSAG